MADDNGFIDTQLITLSGRGSLISTKIPTPIELDHENYDYRIGLKKFQVYNSIPNITEDVNNTILIRPGKNKDFVKVALDTGAYEITHICRAILIDIKNKFPALTDPEKSFQLLPDISTFKSQIVLANDWAVSFKVEHSIATILGFNTTDELRTNGTHKSEHIVQIQVFNSLLFLTNVTEPCIVNNTYRPYIHHHSKQTPPGYNIVVQEIDITYKSLTTNVITDISVWVENEKGERVDFNNEDLTVELKLIRKASKQHPSSAKRRKLNDNFG